jgi:hypothetical protein
MRFRYVAHLYEHRSSSADERQFEAADDEAARRIGEHLWEADVARARRLACFTWCSVHVDAQVWRVGPGGEPWEALVAEWHHELDPPEPACRPPFHGHLWRDTWFEEINELTARLRIQEACIRCGTVRVRDATRPVYDDCAPELRYEPYELEDPVLARTRRVVLSFDDRASGWRLSLPGSGEVLLGVADAETAREQALRMAHEAGWEVVADWGRGPEGADWVAVVFRRHPVPAGTGP